MSDIKFTPLKSNTDLERCFPLLKELRSHLDLEAFKRIYSEAATSNGYSLVGLEMGEKLVALMGYRIMTDFVHGRHLYIDDLIADPSQRSKGLGALMLNHAEELAHQFGCSNLRLCTGIENERGRSFYEKNHWNLRAVVFKKKIERISRV